nr:MAG TPA: hypothetical protein [Bacteriophage sp.]
MGLLCLPLLAVKNLRLLHLMVAQNPHLRHSLEHRKVRPLPLLCQHQRKPRHSL